MYREQRQFIGDEEMIVGICLIRYLHLSISDVIICLTVLSLLFKNVKAYRMNTDILHSVPHSRANRAL